MSPIERKLIYDPRLAPQLANWAIRKDIIRALVELITNSDDSYRRLSRSGTPGTGQIVVRINRKYKETILEVIDEAEGFDDKTMDERVGKYAADTSGFSEGVGVRGLFGRGLKDAILALGEGYICSIKNGYEYNCSLIEENFRLEDPAKIRKKEKRDIEKRTGIKEHGSIVRIVVTKNDIKVPQYDTLVESLSNYYSLRDINSSSKRKVFITEINDKGIEKRERERISYKKPIGKLILEKQLEIPYDGEQIRATLRIWKSKEQTDQDGPCRDGGILICGRSCIHDISLFGFENNQYAARLFGHLECAHLDELIRNKEPLISDKRDGLEWKHRFAENIKEMVCRELTLIVETIRKEEQEKRKAIENEKTKKRFRAAIKKLNKIANKELEDEFGKGSVAGDDVITRKLPPNGFDFIPEFYQVVVNRKASMSLRISVPWILSPGTEVRVTSDNSDIEIIEDAAFIVVDNDLDESGIMTVNPKVIGRGVGAEAIITAWAGDLKAEAYIRVISKIEKKAKSTRKREAKKGLISDIKFDQALDERIRHFFDRENGIIRISSRAPSVRKYLGLSGEGQDKLHCQVLVSELVTDSICRELARRKAESNKLQYLGDDIAGAINKEINTLIYNYAHVIHDLLVDSRLIDN